MELVAREAHDLEAFSTVQGLECIQSTVLPHLASVGRHVHDKRQLAPELRHRERLVVIHVPELEVVYRLVPARAARLS